MPLKQRLKNVLSYLLARASEPSSLRGVVLVLTATGVKLEPSLTEAIVTGGLLIAGLLGVLFPDQLKQGREIAEQTKTDAKGGV